MKVSIIIPIYNASNTLERCLRSIQRQTFADFEAFLVDDCSTDDSVMLCKKFAAQDTRFHILQLSKNQGASNARNVGISNATGDYILFCDSDDYVSERWCQVLLETQIKDKDALVVSNLYDVYPHLAPSPRTLPGDETSQHISFFNLFKLHLDGYTVNKIFCRAIIEDNKIRFSTNAKEGEDVQFITQYALFCTKYTLVSAPLYYYERRCDSITHQYNPNKLKEHLQAFKARLPLVGHANLEEFCDIYLAHLINLLDYTFYRNNSISFLEKLRFNHEVFKSDPFVFCINHSSKRTKNILIRISVKTRSYFIFWGLQKLYILKYRITNNS